MNITVRAETPRTEANFTKQRFSLFCSKQQAIIEDGFVVRFYIFVCSPPPLLPVFTFLGPTVGPPPTQDRGVDPPPAIS